MKTDSGSPTLTLKVNASGSWANVLAGFPAERQPDVRNAAFVLHHIDQRVSFKLVDATGATVATLGVKRGSHDWVEG